ncbi:MAG: hypothetical protein J6W94_00250 [Bacteroidales bacterium]|nr:hypothetical protein [Bacteroidales bacterium]
MKRLILLAALLGLASCTENLLLQNDSDVTLTVGIKSSAASTKATLAGTTDENKINGIQVFVFKVNGGTYVFEAAAKASASSVDITVTTGDKDVIMLVNEPADYTGVTDRATLLGKVSSLANNAPASLVMAGELETTVSTTDHVLDIPVDRMASRIKVSKITNRLRNGNADKNVKIARVFLTGAVASCTFSGTQAGFYATSGVNSELDLGGTAVNSAAEKAAVNSLIYKSINSDVLSDGTSYSTPVSLYAYPNDNSVKATHLVVEMEIDGQYFTYPVPMPQMAGNCTCEVTELVISSIGNVSNGDDILDPGEDEPITFQEASFNITVKPWTVVPVSNGDDGKYTI